MDFQNSYYIVQHGAKLEILSHEKLMKLEPGSFDLIQNFSSHEQAVTQMEWILKSEISDLDHKVKRN
jgi:hypothetical protein